MIPTPPARRSSRDQLQIVGIFPTGSRLLGKQRHPLLPGLRPLSLSQHPLTVADEPLRGGYLARGRHEEDASEVEPVRLSVLALWATVVQQYSTVDWSILPFLSLPCLIDDTAGLVHFGRVDSNRGGIL